MGRYTEGDRTRALAALAERGSLRKAQEATGIPKSQIHLWQQQRQNEAAAGHSSAEVIPDDPDDGEQVAERQSVLRVAEASLQTPIDESYIRALYKYATAIKGGARMDHALLASRSIRPDFTIDQGTHAHVLAMSEVTLTLADPNPPGYVQAIYDRWSMDASAIEDYAGYLYDLHLEMYTQGINDQLVKLGRGPIDGVTDQSVLDVLRSEADKAAAQIAETYNRDLASAVGASWLDVAPQAREAGDLVLTPQERRDAIEQNLTQWSDARADWKVPQVIDTEGSWAYRDATNAFVANNAEAFASEPTGQIVPEDASCEECQDAVDAGEQPMSYWADWGAPHPGCDHDVDVNYPEAEGALWDATVEESGDAMAMAEPRTPATARTGRQGQPDGNALADDAQCLAAGLAVVAEGTGRVLMIQRSIADPEDPAAGTWEFPGGHLEDGERPYEAAVREWTEEVGAILPMGRELGSWTSPNGVYQGFVYVIPAESQVDINDPAGARGVLNPDDPDGDGIEVAAWWAVEDIPDMPALRAECADTDWALLRSAVATA